MRQVKRMMVGLLLLMVAVGAWGQTVPGEPVNPDEFRWVPTKDVKTTFTGTVVGEAVGRTMADHLVDGLKAEFNDIVSVNSDLSNDALKQNTYGAVKLSFNENSYYFNSRNIVGYSSSIDLLTMKKLHFQGQHNSIGTANATSTDKQGKRFSYDYMIKYILDSKLWNRAESIDKLWTSYISVCFGHNAKRELRVFESLELNEYGGEQLYSLMEPFLYTPVGAVPSVKGVYQQAWSGGEPDKPKDYADKLWWSNKSSSIMVAKARTPFPRLRAGSLVQGKVSYFNTSGFKPVKLETGQRVKVLSTFVYKKTTDGYNYVKSISSKIDGSNEVKSLSIQALSDIFTTSELNPDANGNYPVDGEYMLVLGAIDLFNKIYLFEPVNFVIDNKPPAVDSMAFLSAIKDHEGVKYHNLDPISQQNPDASKMKKSALIKWKSITDELSGYQNSADFIYVKLRGNVDIYQATSEKYLMGGYFRADKDNDGTHFLELSKVNEKLTIEELYVMDRAGNRAKIKLTGATDENTYVIGGTKGSYTFFVDQGAPNVYHDTTLPGGGELDYYEKSPSWSGLAGLIKDQKRCYYIDTNNDGFVDLVYANETGGLSVYLNDHMGGFNATAQWSGLTNLGQIAEPVFRFIDMNKDNKEDLIHLDTTAQRAFIYLNSNQGGFSVAADWSIFIGDGSYNGVMYYPQIEDIEKDGVPDFVQFEVIKGKEAVNPYDSRSYYTEKITMHISYGKIHNSSSTGYSESKLIGIARTLALGRVFPLQHDSKKYYFIKEPTFIDYNVDGFKDILFYNNGAHSINLYLNKNGNYGPFPDRWSNTRSFESEQLKIVDINNDGANDIVDFGKFSDESHYGLYFIVNDFHEKQLTNFPGYLGMKKANLSINYLKEDYFIDLNGDGYVDWVNRHDSLAFYQMTLNTKQSNFSDAILWDSRNVKDSKPNEFNFVDLNNDNICEITRVTSAGGIDIYKNIIKTFKTSQSIKLLINDGSKMVRINKLSITGLDKDGNSNGSRNTIPFDIPLELPKELLESKIMGLPTDDQNFIKSTAYNLNSDTNIYTLDLKMTEANEVRLRKLFFDIGYNSFKNVSDITVPLEILRGEADGEYLLTFEVEDILGSINKVNKFYFKVVNNLPPTKININVKGQTPLNPTQVEEYNGDCLVDVVIDDTLFKSFDLTVASDYYNSINKTDLKDIRRSSTSFSVIKDSSVTSAFETLTIIVTSYDKYDNKYISTKEIRLYNDNAAPQLKVTSQPVGSGDPHIFNIEDESSIFLAAFKSKIELPKDNTPPSNINDIPYYSNGQWQNMLYWTEITTYNQQSHVLKTGDMEFVYLCDQWGNSNSADLAMLKKEWSADGYVRIEQKSHLNPYLDTNTNKYELKGNFTIACDLSMGPTDPELVITTNGATATNINIEYNSATPQNLYSITANGGTVKIDNRNGPINFKGVGSGTERYKWAGIKKSIDGRLEILGTQAITFENARAALVFENPGVVPALSNFTFTNCLIGIHWLDNGATYKKLTVNSSTFTNCVYGVKLDLIAGSYATANAIDYLMIDDTTCSFNNMSRAKFYWNGVDF